jgi:hypothetical protein
MPPGKALRILDLGDNIQTLSSHPTWKVVIPVEPSQVVE